MFDDNLKNNVHTYLDSNSVEVVGMSRELFEYLVEKIRPRRVQALHTIIKLVAMIFVLSVSIILMERFKKFEELSLLVHIFITVFICALPFIFNFLVVRDDMKTRVRHKVKKYLRKWVLLESK